jgi:putative transposase
MYNVRRLKIGKSPLLDKLATIAGELYTEVLTYFWRVVRRQGIWLKPSSMMRFKSSNSLHAHSADAIVQSFYGGLSSWRVRSKVDPTAKPPKKRCKYYKLQWKKSAMRLINGVLWLSNGRGNEPLQVPWKWDLPVLIEIGFDGKEYELRATYAVEPKEKPLGNKIAAVDLGEVHSMVAFDGDTVTIMNGRELRSKKRYMNKTVGALSAHISKTKKGSKRNKKLIQTKRKQLKALNNQIKDITHKQTSALISTLHSAGVQILVIGDIRNIRLRSNVGRRNNQKIHQMSSGTVRHKLSYKAELFGMRVTLQNEAYTSQECPRCNTRKKPNNRNYSCACGFRYHRDGVGAMNILKKYRGEDHVVGVMASPFSMRYTPHMRCSLQIN